MLVERDDSRLVESRPFGRPIRILHLVSTFAVKTDTKWLVQIARHTDRRDFDLHAACFYDGGPIRDELERLGVVTHDLDCPSERDPRAVLRVRRLIRRLNCDIVHTHLLRADLLGGLAARWAGVPQIVSTVYAIGAFCREKRRRTDRLLDAVCARLPTHAIAVSEAVRRDCVRRLGMDARRITVLHTGIDPSAETGFGRTDPGAATAAMTGTGTETASAMGRDVGTTAAAMQAETGRRDGAATGMAMEARAQALRASWSVPAGRPLVLTIARLSYEKGVDVLIDAAAELHEKLGDVRFVVVGDGSDRSALTERIRRHGLEGVVRLAGFVADVWPAIAAADVVCLPSKSEGMPNVLLEAMSAGKPIVASAVGGIPEAVESGRNGLLVPPNSPHDLAAGIARLVGDAAMARRVGEAARATIEQRFLAKDVVRRYEQLYRRLAAGGRRLPSAGATPPNQVGKQPSHVEKQTNQVERRSNQVEKQPDQAERQPSHVEVQPSTSAPSTAVATTAATTRTEAAKAATTTATTSTAATSTAATSTAATTAATTSTAATSTAAKSTALRSTAAKSGAVPSAPSWNSFGPLPPAKSRPAGTASSRDATSKAVPAASTGDLLEPPPAVEVLGLPIRPLRVRGLIDLLARRARAGLRTTACYANAHTVNLACRDPAFRDLLRRSDVLYADGASVVWASRWATRRLPERMTAADYFGDFAACCAEDGLSLFLLGGRPGVAEKAAGRLQAAVRGLRIVGTQHGYFSPAESNRIVETINAASPDVLAVGLSSPRQERWLADYGGSLRVPVRWCVGALFDYWAGVEQRGPAWLCRMGGEWLFRLWVDPAGKWQRYLIGNPLFVLNTIRWCLGMCRGVRHPRRRASIPAMEPAAAAPPEGEGEEHDASG